MRAATCARRRQLYEQARARVARDHRRPLTLGAVAAELACSPRELQRAYAQFGAGTFREELRACRLRAGAALLAGQPQLTVAQVAALVGYRRSSHFAHAFRARYGHTPGEHRRRAAGA